MKTPTHEQWSHRFLIPLLLVSLLSGCAAITSGSHFDETANFSAYETFSWIGDDPLISVDSSIPVSAMAKSMINSAIRGELTKKGYAYVDDRDDADFVVAYTIGTRENIRVDSYPVEFRGRWGWHVPYSYYHYREISAHSYTKGTLGVDVFDNDSRKPIWHGWAEKTVTQSDRQDPGPSINEGIRLLFESFPR
jgi:hypothetical protein